MTGCIGTKGEGVDFGLLNGVGPNESRTKVKKTVYDTRFADWLMVHREANRRDAKAKAYTLGKVLRDYDTRLSNVQEAEKVAAFIMSGDYETSTLRHKLFAVEHYMAYQGMTVSFRKPKADKRCSHYLT